MVMEITRAIIAVLLILGAIGSIIWYPTASNILLTLAGVVIGYYFKTNEQAIIAGTKNVLGIRK
jgi:hypothetical protein